MHSPKEVKVPAIIWKEAVQVTVSFSEGNELQMFYEKNQTSLKLLSGK